MLFCDNLRVEVKVKKELTFDLLLVYKVLYYYWIKKKWYIIYKVEILPLIKSFLTVFNEITIYK